MPNYVFVNKDQISDIRYGMIGIWDDIGVPVEETGLGVSIIIWADLTLQLIINQFHQSNYSHNYYI